MRGSGVFLITIMSSLLLTTSCSKDDPVEPVMNEDIPTMGAGHSSFSWDFVEGEVQVRVGVARDRDEQPVALLYQVGESQRFAGLTADISIDEWERAAELFSVAMALHADGPYGGCSEGPECRESLIAFSGDAGSMVCIDMCSSQNYTDLRDFMRSLRTTYFGD